ncbi:methionyl-tRNA formyltransferase [Candidatus Kaiserbacteria bacterium]|nr:methionyl-tRNA formyltransferase [Candidatus Kaiserbacteria bacterium]
MQKNHKIAFFGTPYFAVYVLDELEHAGISPQLVVTVPDKPAERGLEMKAPAVKLWAEKNAIPFIQPEKLETKQLGGFDFFVVAAYGKLLPKEILDLPRFGTLNVHPSLLPKFRGPSPIEAQILNDVKEVGVSIILLDEEADHGPILAQKTISLPEPIGRKALEEILWHQGGKLLAETILPYMQGRLKPQEQAHAEATFTPKLSKKDGLLDLSGDARKNYLKYLAYEGWPGTYFFAKRFGKEVWVKITNALYQNGKFTPTKIIPEGKKEMEYADFARSDR